MGNIEFMWRIPAYPTDGSSREAVFIKQITDTLDYIQGSFAGAFTDDHFLPWTAVDHPGARDSLPQDVDTLECMTTISYLAAAYPQLVFGGIVLCQSYRNPALTAKMGSTLQLLTGGRYVMGIGAGWHEPDYEAYGYEFVHKPSVRLAQMKETIQIIKKMWTESPATFEGEHYRIKNAYCEPRPNPMPPLLIGGGGEKVTLRIVAEYADWWNYCDSTDIYAHKMEVLRSHCEAIGRDFNEIVKTWDGLQIVVAETEAEARQIYENSPFKRRGAVVGNPDQVTEQLQAYVDLGVEIFFMRFDDFPGQTGIRLFTEKVLPRFK
jgi:alkanesulfonate monooxygenase SsuD/methylene tetrahydromethanopterin reductase-like flavin-dependent oxidoreductase (luciferase family)